MAPHPETTTIFTRGRQPWNSFASVVGCCKNFTYRFKRWKGVLLDNTGSYGPEAQYLNMKFCNEIRLFVGVAKVYLDNGKIIGR